MKRIKETTQVKCKMIGLWFLSTALPFIYIYVCTKFHFNPFCTFQDMAWTGNTYEKWLSGDNTVNIQGRIMVLVYCPSSHCHLSINQVSFQSLLYFSRYCPDRQHLWKMVMEGLHYKYTGYDYGSCAQHFD